MVRLLRNKKCIYWLNAAPQIWSPVFSCSRQLYRRLCLSVRNALPEHFIITFHHGLPWNFTTSLETPPACVSLIFKVIRQLSRSQWLKILAKCKFFLLSSSFFLSFFPPKLCPGHISETSGLIFMIQTTHESPLLIDVHWLGRFALGPKQGAHKGPKSP